MDREQTAQFLWSLLDDIDTASDRAKGDDKIYREIVERIHRRRFEVGSTDGYTVTFTCPMEHELENARLIAAATDLHAALVGLVDAWVTSKSEASDMTAAITVATMAIDKAEGR